MNDIEARDAVKITEVCCSVRIAKIERTSSDDEIGQRDGDTFSCLLTTDAGNLGCGFSNPRRTWSLRNRSMRP